MLRIKLIVAAVIYFAVSPAFSTGELTGEELRVLQKINADSNKRQAAISVLAAPVSQRLQSSASLPVTGQAKRGRTEQIKTVSILRTPPVGSVPELLSRNVEPIREEEKLKQYSPCAGLNFMLRQNWTDIGFVSCPQTVDKATGAEVSYTDNKAKNNRTWAINGTAALVYNSLTGNPDGSFVPYNITAGTYVTMNRVVNSAAAAVSSDVDKIAYGGLLELGYVTIGGANYFRVRGGSVENNLKETISTNITGEFIPVDYRYNIHYPFRPFGGTAPFIMRIDPAFLVQYAKLTTPNGQVLDFSGRDEALRVGPQLALNFFPLPGRQDFFSRMRGKVSYHWAEETFSGRNFSLFQSDVGYNLDEAGYFALTFIYNRGRDEDTGEYKNLFKVSLTGKI